MGHGPAKKEWEGAGIQNLVFCDRNEPMMKRCPYAKLPWMAEPGEKFVYGSHRYLRGN